MFFRGHAGLHNARVMLAFHGRVRVDIFQVIVSFGAGLLTLVSSYQGNFFFAVMEPFSAANT